MSSDERKEQQFSITIRPDDLALIARVAITAVASWPESDEKQALREAITRVSDEAGRSSSDMARFIHQMMEGLADLDEHLRRLGE